MLAAVEKREINPFLKYANMPIVLWALSAALLSLGSAYFAGYQQCIRDASDLGEKYHQLSYQLFERNERIGDAVQNARSISELRDTANIVVSQHPELRDINSLTIEGKLSRIEDRIDLSRISDLRALTYPKNIFSRERERFESGEFQYPHPYINFGFLDLRTSDKDLVALKAYVSNARKMAEGIFHSQQWTVIFPSCSPVKVAASLVGYNPQIMYAEIEPVLKSVLDAEKNPFQPLPP
jgi:hypothetical protein